MGASPREGSSRRRTSGFDIKALEIFIPNNKLADYIEDNELRKKYDDKIHITKYYENLSYEFPYLKLKLKDIGIPKLHILTVETDKATEYVELTGENYE